jgi:hypothetical protein
MRIVTVEDPPSVGLDPVEDCGRGRRRGRRSLLAEAFNNRLVKYPMTSERRIGHLVLLGPADFRLSGRTSRLRLLLRDFGEHALVLGR